MMDEARILIHFCLDLKTMILIINSSSLLNSVPMGNTEGECKEHFKLKNDFMEEEKYPLSSERSRTWR